MKLIVGLGNPGEKYAGTRHNIGYMVIDKLAKEIGQSSLSWQSDKKNQLSFAKTADIVLCKPETYMNNSGMAVRTMLDFYKMEAKDVWVIHEDIDLPIGKIRIRAS